MGILRADYQKITQAVCFLLQKEATGIPKLKLVKLIWASDRYHVRKYGRFVTDDDYLAMKNGPVGSMTKDVIEFSVNEYSPLSDEDLFYVKNYITNKDGQLTAVCNADCDMLSETDIEALNFAWNTFKNYSQKEIIEFTHKYPEWKKHENEINSGIKVVDIDEKDFFENPKENEIEKDPFAQELMDDEQLQISKELFLEYA